MKHIYLVYQKGSTSPVQPKQISVLDDGVALNLKNLCKFATMNFNYKARVTVNGKTYKAKTTAESPEIAAQKIGVRAATKFPAQNISVGEVEVDAVTTLRNIFKI